MPAPGQAPVRSELKPLLESLADHMGVPAADAARQLLGMSEKERWALRRRFAEMGEGGDGPAPGGGGRGGGGGDHGGVGSDGSDGGDGGGGGYGAAKVVD